MRMPDAQVSDILTLGETLVSLYVQGQRLDSASCLAKSIAGAEANVAIGLARLGARPAMISRVGPDPFGVEVHRTLRGEGVDVGHVRTGGSPTGMMVKEVLGPHLTNVYYYRAGSAATELTGADVPGELVAATRRVHVTGVTLALGEGPAEAVRTLVGLARDHGVPVSFDPNIRRKLWTLEEAAAACRTLLPDVDDLLLGEDEALAISATTTCADALSALTDLGVPRVVIRRGERGCVAAERGGEPIDLPAHPAPSVVDTVGAGDAFTAGYLFELLRGRSFADALRTGSWTAAQVVAHRGDYEGFPRSHEYDAFVSGQEGFDR